MSTETMTRAVNYDARTGDIIVAKLPGWHAPGYLYVTATTPRTVVLREIKYVGQKVPGRYAGVFTYERLKKMGATYAEG